MKTCLIIDDVASNRMMTEVLVANLGFDVITVDSAEKGLAMVEEKPAFDVILVDWHMPDISGIEFLGMLRQTRQGRNTVILIYSGQEDYKGTREVLKAGADGFVFKPVSQEKLEEKFKAAALI